MAGETHRYSTFRRHLTSCPACNSEQVDMCQQGYLLLVGALGIVSNASMMAM